MTRQNHRYNTLVFHRSPDLESTRIFSILISYLQLAQRLGIRPNPDFKFIPAGPLQQEDWPGVETLTVSSLDKAGYMFIDCGDDPTGVKSRFDHHSLDIKESSLDIILRETGGNVVLNFLKGVFEKISDSDTRGAEVVRDTDFQNSKETPHVQRHLRNWIIGLNLMFPDNPMQVMRITSLAYSGIDCLIRAVAEGRLRERMEAAGLTADDLAGKTLIGLLESGSMPEDEETQLKAASEAFLIKNVTAGLAISFAREVSDSKAQPADVDRYLGQFKSFINQGLMAMEEDWLQAEKDYWSESTKGHVFKRKQVVKGKDITEVIRGQDFPAIKQVVKGKSTLKSLKCVLVVGYSDSESFGKVARAGNKGDNPMHPDKPLRKGATVVIQFRSNGRFTISGRFKLNKVAAFIRQVDLRRKGVDLSLIAPEVHYQVGHMAYPNQEGELVQSLLLAFPKAFGNYFRANPNGPMSALNNEEIVDQTIRALTYVPIAYR